MMTYEPLKKFLEEHGITYYDLHQTSLPHGSIYMFRNDETVSLPTINYLMYCLGLTSIDQVVKYYRDGVEAPPASVKSLETVDNAFDKFYTKKRNGLIIPKTPAEEKDSDDPQLHLVDKK